MNKENGYTLLELVLVIILVGVAFPGLLAFFTNSMQDSVKNEVITQAIILAQGKMEQITTDKHEPGRGMNYIKLSGQYPVETIGPFVRSVTVQDVTLSGVDGVKVSVSISHPSMSQEFTLNHFFSDYGGD
jgi:prepilin-type N-terminal cleavage/methylation domain-containing protein